MVDSDRSGAVIAVTGFGPYGSFDDNPSAAVVRRLKNEGLKDVMPNAVLHTTVIPVTYEQVEAKVSELWQRFRPDLVVHVGAHPSAQTIKIEQQSFGRGYCLLDMECQVPCGNMCPCGFEATQQPQPILVSEFDCKKIADRLSQFLDSDCLKIEPSDNPGRYLCAYSYFISLSHDRRRSLFVHVPAFDDDVTEQLVARALKRIISECLKELGCS